MATGTLTIKQILDLLTQNQTLIAKHTAGLTEAHLHTPASQGEWSVNDILAHLRSCSDMWGNAIGTILTQEKPTIRAMNPRTWIEQTNYPEQKFRASFRAFSKQRTDLLKRLEALPTKDWKRTAIVTGAGKPLERTVFFYAHWLATHERTHVKQIGRITSTLRT